jgi:hypothetical protein
VRLLLLLWLVAGGCAWSQPLQLELLNEQLTTAEQAHFERALGYIVELYQRQGLRPAARVRARVFSGYQDFQAFQRDQRSGADGAFLSHTGYYNPNEREVVLWRSRRFPAIFIHEAQHGILRSAYPRPPKWLNEGLSEYFEGLNLDGPGVSVDPQGPRLRRLRRYLGPELGAHIVRVLTMSEREFEARSERGLDSYTCSWALNYYLWSRPRGEQMLGEVLRALRAGENSFEVVDRVYPGGVRALQAELGPFYQQLATSAVRVSK